MPAPVKGPFPSLCGGLFPQTVRPSDRFLFCVPVISIGYDFSVSDVSDSPTGSARAGRSSGRRCAARACRTGVMTYPSRLASHALRLPDAPPPIEGIAPHGLCAAHEVNAGPRVLMLEAERNRHRPDAVRADTPHAPPILFSVMDALFFAVHCSRSCHRRIGGDGHSVADQREFFGHIIAQRIADMGVLLFSQHSPAKTPHSATSSIPAHIPAPTRVTPQPVF